MTSRKRFISSPHRGGFGETGTSKSITSTFAPGGNVTTVGTEVPGAKISISPPLGKYITAANIINKAKEIINFTGEEFAVANMIDLILNVKEKTQHVAVF